MSGAGAGEGAGAGAGAGAGTGGMAGTGSTGAAVTEDAASAFEKARRYRAAEQQAAAVTGPAASAGASSVLPATASPAHHFSAFGYRQSASSSSSSAAATPLYSPEGWGPRHLPVLSHDLSFSTPPSGSSTSSPSARGLADLYFAHTRPGASDAGGGGAAGGQWHPASSAPSPVMPLSFPASFSHSPAPAHGGGGGLSGSMLPQSSYPSSYVSSPAVLSPSSASGARDVEDIWAMEVAKINRQAAVQQYATQQQQQQHASLADSGSTSPSPPVPRSAVPLGPPVPRPSSAQSKLLSLLSQSRAEDDAVKRQHLLYQQLQQQQQQQQQQSTTLQQQRHQLPLHEPHQQQQHGQQHAFPYHTSQSHQPQPQQQQQQQQQQHPQPHPHSHPQSHPLHTQRRTSDRLLDSAALVSEQQQFPPGAHFAPARSSSPAPLPGPLLFNAPPPSQSRSSSTPQTDSHVSALGGAAPRADSVTPTFGRKPLTARSPSPRSASANQPFQPRESFSGFGAMAAFAYPTQPSDQHRPQPTLDTLAMMQRQQHASALPAAAEAAPSLVNLRAEAARAALAYLTGETEPSTVEQRAAISSLFSAAEQHTSARSFGWPPSQPQQQPQPLLSAQQAGYPPDGVSQVQSFTVHHIVADRTQAQQQQFPSTSTEQPQLAAEAISAGQPDLSHLVGAHTLSTSQRPLSPSFSHSVPPHAAFSHHSNQPEPAPSYSSTASSSSPPSGLSAFVALQLLSAAGALSSPSQAAYQGFLAAAGAMPELASLDSAAAGSLYADMQRQQQSLQQQHPQQAQQSPAAVSAELSFPPQSQSRLPWLSGYPLSQSVMSADVVSAALRHRSFSAAAGMPADSEAEARVKVEEDDAEMERLVAMRMHQQQHQQQQQQQLHQQSHRQQQSSQTVKLEPASYQIYRPSGPSAGEQRQQQYLEQHQQQHERYYVPAPSPTLGLPSDPPLSVPPIFSSSAAHTPHFAASAAETDSAVRMTGEQRPGGYHYEPSELTGSIPTFSSSMQSDPLLPTRSRSLSRSTAAHSHPPQAGQLAAASSASSQSAVSAPAVASASSTKRRAGEVVSSAELWVCPFNCNKVYRTTSSRSIARHMQNCPNKPLYESFLAAGRAAGLEDSYGLGGKRRQKKRRKNAELLEHERWNCPNGCGTFFRSTSTKSIHRHKRLCRFGQSSASDPKGGGGDEDRPDDEDDEGNEDEQRDEAGDEGGQGDDDADDDEGAGGGQDQDHDERRSDTRTQQMAQYMQASSAVDGVADELLALSLSISRPRAHYKSQTTGRQSQRGDEDSTSLPSSAEKEQHEQVGEYKQLQPSHASTRSSSTPPLLFLAAATVAADADNVRRMLLYRRHSFDSSSAQSSGRKQRLGAQQRQSSCSDSPSAHSSHRKDSQSGTDSGGSNSKNSQLSSASAGLSSSSESSTSSQSSSAASSSSSSSAASQPHTPTAHMSPAATQRSLATTAQRSGTEAAKRQLRRRANSRERTAAPEAATASPFVPATAAQRQHKHVASLTASASTSSSPPAASSSSSLSLPTVRDLGAAQRETGGLVSGKSRSARQLQLDRAEPADGSGAGEVKGPG